MQKIQNYLENRSDLLYLLFRRGWMISNRKLNSEKLSKFPFFGKWKIFEECNIQFILHQDSNIFFYTSSKNNLTFFLIGHAYNPFTMEENEINILQYISDVFFEPIKFQERINELTGIFILGWIRENRYISYILDPSGIQTACYGNVNSNFILVSHPQIAADVYNLKFDIEVSEIVKYKWYPRVLGSYLPGDLTQYKELKRIIPNFLYHTDLQYYHTTYRRIYPLNPLPEVKSEEDYKKIIYKGANILKCSMDLVVKKWKNPAISLTGGIDSQTTFAAAVGNYNRINAFSYLSNHEESIDIIAARKTANAFNVPYRLYEIPIDSNKINDYNLKAAIFEHNSGYISFLRPNEMRKRIVLEQDFEFDVEVKSWVSETIRACQYKRYRKKKLPRLSPQLFRNLYKIFITNRSLAHKLDKIFADYIEDYEYNKLPKGYDITDMYFWEVGWGSWGSLNISEMMVYSDITIIYNNRKFLDLLLRTPLEKRISDDNHRDMKKYLNEKLYDMNIEVVNMSEDWRRAAFLRAIFDINMLFKK